MSGYTAVDVNLPGIRTVYLNAAQTLSVRAYVAAGVTSPKVTAPIGIINQIEIEKVTLL